MRRATWIGIFGVLLALSVAEVNYAIPEFNNTPSFPLHNVELGDLRPNDPNFQFTAFHADMVIPGDPKDPYATPNSLLRPFTVCNVCHGADLRGGTGQFAGPSCYLCHGARWDRSLPQYPDDHVDEEHGFMHGPGGKEYPFTNGCTLCHGPDLRGGIALSCFTCHGREWNERGPSSADRQDSYNHHD